MNAVFKRELRAYFSSPMGYVFVGIFMLVLGLVFLIGNINGDGYNSNANFAMTLGTMATPFAFLVPLLTMRSFSEERRLKIDQLYLTSPLPIYKVVLGKFFAASCVLLITLLLSVIYPIILAVLGSPRAGEIFTSYVGFFLMGCTAMAVGLLISACTQSQVVAAVATFGVFFLLMMGTQAVSMISAGFLRDALNALALFGRFTEFTSGILGLSPIIYYITVTAACLFVTAKLIERRRWSGN